MSASLFDLPDPDEPHQEGSPSPSRGRGRAPLAVRMRPRTLDEVVGQKHLLRAGSPLRVLAGSDAGPAGPSSIILWGPPGTGKTTLAHVIARGHGTKFVELSAITAGVKDVRRVMEQALTDRDLHGRSTVLFLDEIHRFTKAQQDALLPGVENGWVILVAATTENPSFSVISPLLSRSLMLTLHPLERSDIEDLLERAVTDRRGLNAEVTLDEAAKNHLLDMADGDARKALTSLDAAAGVAFTRVRGRPGTAGHPREDGQQEASDGADGSARGRDGAVDDHRRAPAEDREPQGEVEPHEQPFGTVSITLEDAEEALNRAALRYDKQGDQHYDVISAFIKSIRGSDVDAAMHYMARMLEAGEDPRFIARRLIISASEDIGMADPTALQTAVAAAQAVQLIGMPEGRIPLAQAVTHLATSAKSNASYLAINEAIADVRAGKAGPVPTHLRDGHSRAAAALGHGEGYRYAHDEPNAVATQQYPPDRLVGRDYYRPTLYGREKELSNRVDRLRRIVRGDHDA